MAVSSHPMTPRAGGVKERVILDLCAGTGAWSQPYVEAGYEVRRVELPQDVRLLRRQERLSVRGILAAPPCTMFSRAGARWTRSNDEMREALSIVDACLRAVLVYRPSWWALENPIGKLKNYLGDPVYKFDPCDFGDPWTKRTWLWGSFKPPIFHLTIEPILGDITTNRRHGMRNRSVTPPAFARAFFAANP